MTEVNHKAVKIIRAELDVRSLYNMYLTLKKQ